MKRDDTSRARCSVMSASPPSRPLLPPSLFVRLVAHLYLAPLSAQTLGLRPAPANRGLRRHPAAGVLWLFQRPLVFCTNGLFFLPLGLWWLRVWDILVGSRGGPPLQVEWAGHGLPCSTQIGQPPPGPGPWPAVPWASASCGFGLPVGPVQNQAAAWLIFCLLSHQRQNSLGLPPKGKTT